MRWLPRDLAPESPAMRQIFRLRFLRNWVASYTLLHARSLPGIVHRTEATQAIRQTSDAAMPDAGNSPPIPMCARLAAGDSDVAAAPTRPLLASVGAKGSSCLRCRGKPPCDRR